MLAIYPMGKSLACQKLRVLPIILHGAYNSRALTSEIANCIEAITGARGVAVVIEAQHLCMMMRGIEKQNSVMTTSVMLARCAIIRVAVWNF